MTAATAVIGICAITMLKLRVTLPLTTLPGAAAVPSMRLIGLPLHLSRLAFLTAIRR